MIRGIHDEERDIRALRAAFGPVLIVVLVLSAGCGRDAPPTILVPMISATDDAFAAGTSATEASEADGGGEAGAVELEPSPPNDAVACRRDVACHASLATNTPLAPIAQRHLPSPFEHCELRDDKGRAFTARETRDARLTDPARCCYVSFVDCVRRAH